MLIKVKSNYLFCFFYLFFFFKTCRKRVLAEYESVVTLNCSSVKLQHFKQMKPALFQTRGRAGLSLFWRTFCDCPVGGVHPLGLPYFSFESVGLQLQSLLWLARHFHNQDFTNLHLTEKCKCLETLWTSLILAAWLHTDSWCLRCPYESPWSSPDVLSWTLCQDTAVLPWQQPWSGCV